MPPPYLVEMVAEVVIGRRMSGGTTPNARVSVRAFGGGKEKRTFYFAGLRMKKGQAPSTEPVPFLNAFCRTVLKTGIEPARYYCHSISGIDCVTKANLGCKYCQTGIAFLTDQAQFQALARKSFGGSLALN